MDLCRLGVFTADEDGFFISEIVENVIDNVIRSMGVIDEPTG